MADDFIERKHGRQEITYEVPQLEPILNDTYGIILYQEQVQKIAASLASYSLGEADLLRRAMGKKKPEEMAKQKVRFVSGCTKMVSMKRYQTVFSSSWRNSLPTVSTNLTLLPMDWFPIKQRI